MVQILYYEDTFFGSMPKYFRKKIRNGKGLIFDANKDKIEGVSGGVRCRQYRNVGI